MRSIAWSLRYKYNGTLLRDPEGGKSPIKNLLFRTMREANKYKEALSYKDTVQTIRVEIRIEPRPSLINRS